jgi:hypothetical protein
VKTSLLAFSYLALSLMASAGEPSVPSPDKRYLVTLQSAKPDTAFPVIVLRDTSTGRDVELFDYDSVGQGTSALHAVWSPDSRHVALTLAMGPATQNVAVYRITNGTAHEVPILPIPKSLDAVRHGHRGGPSVDCWHDNRTLWVNDGQKSRSFRYRFTKQGKLLADHFKEQTPE